MTDTIPPSRGVAGGPGPGAVGERDGERHAPSLSVSPEGETAPGAGPGCASSPTVEQLQQAERMIRAGHHPDVIEATTRVPRDRIAALAARIRTTPRRRR